MQEGKRGLAPEVRSRFHSLEQKREDHTLSDAELAELVAPSVV